MPRPPIAESQLIAENAELRARLNQAEETLRAVRSGEVDALMVTAAGMILYANRRFAEMLKMPLEKVIGSAVRTWIAPGSQPILQSLLEKGAGEERRGELSLAASDGTRVPVYLSVNNLLINEMPDAYCLVATDLTEHKRSEAIAASEKLAQGLLTAANQSRGELLRVIEEKTRAEKALAQESRRNHLLLRSVSDGVNIMDADGNVLEVSDSFCQMLGYPREELIGANVSLWDTQWSPKELKDKLAEQIGTEGRSVFEARHRRRDGSLYDAEINVQSLELDGKRVIFGSARDITERKQATEKLEARDAYLTAIIENQPGLIWLKDVKGRFLAMNHAFAVSCGREIQDVLGKTDLDIWPRKMAEEYIADDGKVMQAGRPIVVEELIKDKNEPKWFETFKTAIRDSHGNIIGSTGYARDITERKRMDTALRESEAEFRILAEAMPQIVWITRPDGWNTYFNQQWMDYTGLTLEESRGHGWNKPFHPDDQQRAWDAWQQATETIGTYSIESRLRRADGAYRWWLVRGVPLKGATGEILKWFGTCTDIHDMKMTELEIARYVEQLQIAVMSTVEVATTLSEMRDPYTAGHERRVGKIAAAIGTELGLEAQRIEGLRVAGYLHDIGKITIPTEILSKPGKLSAVEFKLIRGHAQAGYDVLKNVDFPWPVAEVALQHHERMDGSGYPGGLKGDAILLEAKILAVADVVEAMCSHRPYRVALGIEAALAEIERGRGTVYDPVVVDACLKLFREKSYTIPA
jgi:PAS domain S-box-containing protein